MHKKNCCPFLSIFAYIMLFYFSAFNMVYAYFMPDAIVVQCGADGLAGDPHGGSGLTLDGYCLCIQKILNKHIPTLLLGGG